MPTPEQLAVAERMKEARLRAGVLQKKTLSQAAMAKLVGEELDEVMHQTQWSRYESGESEPSLRVIGAAARVSGLVEAYIAFGTPPTPIRPLDAEERAGSPREPSSLPPSPMVQRQQKPQRRGAKKTPPRKRASGE